MIHNLALTTYLIFKIRVLAALAVIISIFQYQLNTSHFIYHNFCNECLHYKECPFIFYSVIYLFGVLRRLQHCTGHIMTGSWKGRGNQYIQFVRVLYCKLPTNGKQLPAFPLKAVLGIEPRPQRWEARVLPLSHRGPFYSVMKTRMVFKVGDLHPVQLPGSYCDRVSSFRTHRIP